MLLALLDVPPTHLLTLHSKDLDRTGMQRSWSAFKKRIERKIGKPPIYLAVTAKSAKGEGGQHLHALLWTGYLHAESLQGFARGTGLGAPDIQMLPQEPENQIGRAQMIGYVLGQLGPVFGSKDHLRHAERARSQRRYSTSTRRVLEVRMPELFAALDRARDGSVPDDLVFSATPRFSREGDEGAVAAVWSGQAEAADSLPHSVLVRVP